MEVTFKARTAFGLGGQEFYIETVESPDTPDWIDFAKRKFAVKFGVELDRIEIIKGGDK